ncbi:MAG: enoyl-CoA hydratase-related protein [Micromonosporaceae bacterium]
MTGNAAQESVKYGVDGAVATITLNRPAAMNALNTQTKEALLASLRRAGSDPAIRAVILTGAGRGFCAGQDLREHALLLETGQGAGTVRQHYNPIVTAIVSMPKPVIAAVNGVAAGAGASLALACDLRIAAEGARMVMAFAQVAFGPDSGASWTLQHLVGRGRAAEMLMLAEPVNAARMLELGLVSAVVPADELPEAASRLAARLAEGPTAAYAAIKEALDFAACHELPEALAKEAELQEALAETEDHRGATEAFSRKERPQFKGR